MAKIQLGDIVGMVGTGFAGYAKGQQQYRQRQQEDEDRAYLMRQRARQDALVADRDRLASGLAIATPGEMGPPTEAQEAAGGLRPPTMRPMTDDEMQTGIAGLSLRSGDVAGYNAAIDRSKKLRREAADKQFGQQILSMPDEQLFENAKKWVNESPYVPAMLGYDPKTKTLRVTTADGSITNLTPAQARQYLYSAHQIGQGDVAAGLQTMLATSQGREENAGRRVGDANKTAGALAEYGIKQDQLANDARRTTAAVNASNAQVQQANRGTPVQMVDAKTGQPVIGHLVNVGGRSVFQPANVPEGLKLPNARPQISSTDLIKAAEMFIGQKGPNGTPMGPEEAMDAARAALMSQGSGQDDAVDLAKVAEILRANKGKQAARPPVSGLATGAPSDPVAYSGLQRSLGNQSRVSSELLRPIRNEAEQASRLELQRAIQRASQGQ